MTDDTSAAVKPEAGEQRSALPTRSRALLTAVAGSSFGDGFRYAALPLLLVSVGASGELLGALLAAGTAPFLVVGLFGGVLVDRLDRIRIMRIADAGRTVVGTCFVAQLTFQLPGMVPAAFVVAVVMGIGEAVTFPALFAVSPVIAGEKHLPRFNSLVGTFQTTGRDLVGPLAGSALVVAAREGPFLLDAVTFLFSWFLLGRVGRSGTRADQAAPSTVRQDIRDAFGWLRHQPLLNLLTLCAALINLGNMGFLATQSLYVVRGLDAPAIGYGILLASAAAAGSATGLVFSRWLHRYVRLTLMPWAAATVAFGMIVLVVSPSLPIAVVGTAINGAGFLTYNVCGVSVRQSLTPDKWRGRSDALYRAVSWGALPIGSLLGGAITELVSYRAPAALTAACALIAVLILGVAVLRHNAAPIGDAQTD